MGHQEEVLAGFALPDHPPASGDAYRLELAGQALQDRRRKRGEQTVVAQKNELVAAHPALVQRPEPGQRREPRRAHHGSDAGQRRAHSPERHERRDEQRSGGQAHVGQALEHAEQPRQQMRRGHPRQQRPPRDVQHGPRHAGHDQQRVRGARGRPHRERRERSGPRDGGPDQRPSEGAAADQAQGGEAAHDPARSERGAEVPGRRRAQAEHADRQNHGKDVERADGHVLHAGDGEQGPRLRLGAKRGDPGQGIARVSQVRRLGEPDVAPARRRGQQPPPAPPRPRPPRRTRRRPARGHRPISARRRAPAR